MLTKLPWLTWDTTGKRTALSSFNQERSAVRLGSPCTSSFVGHEDKDHRL
jgi:hypothetical protein